MKNDAALASKLRAYMSWWASGSKEDRLDLYGEIANAKRTNFPREPALEALARLDARTLWKTFVAEELAELREWSEDAGLRASVKRFEAAEDDIPFLDPGRIPLKIREGVMRRDKGTCAECGSKDHPQIDHINPHSEGGSSSDPENLRVLCRKCNAAKGARPSRARRQRRPRAASARTPGEHPEQAL
jgi:hypothetical protein